MQETQQPQIDLTNTTSIEGFDGGVLFGQGVILRKISKFVLGSDEDGVIPIPIFYDLVSKKILIDSLPREIRDEYKEFSF
jgi:hypothetical protein